MFRTMFAILVAYSERRSLEAYKRSQMPRVVWGTTSIPRVPRRPAKGTAMTHRPRPGDGLPTILVIGHARHGKDTVCEMLGAYGFRFTSSSEFVGREIIFDQIGHEYNGDFDAMFEDRMNRREEWFKWIEAYNTPDETRTARTMLERGNHMYCGMRRKEELEACVAAELFDMIWWVDRSLHLPPEAEGSNTLDLTHVTHFIDNNGTLSDLSLEVHKALCRGISE